MDIKISSLRIMMSEFEEFLCSCTIIWDQDLFIVNKIIKNESVGTFAGDYM